MASLSDSHAVKHPMPRQPLIRRVRQLGRFLSERWARS